MKEELYELPCNEGIREIAHKLEDYLIAEERMTCKVLRTENGTYIVQGGYVQDDLLRWTGMTRDIMVQFVKIQDRQVKIIMSYRKKLPLAAALMIGLFLIGSLGLIGVYSWIRQYLLVYRVRKKLGQWLVKP